MTPVAQAAPARTAGYGGEGACAWANCAVAALAAFLLSLCGAAAAAPAAAATHGADAASPDAGMARRMLACTPCHGKEGRATSAGYFPRIAGKPAGYLFNQLVNFRDGRRPNSAMADLVEHLDDAYLRDIAAYFAALDLAYPPPPAPAATATPEMLARGEVLARQGDAKRGVPACTACHGERLTGVLPALPGLVGLPRDYLLGQLGAWREGARHTAIPDCMAAIARRMADADVAAVTLWIASQKPGADMKPAAAGTLAELPLACGTGLQ
jgi:cytochrome c553